MISEGSCDTEVWSDDAENSALHHWNKLCFFFTNFLCFSLNKCRLDEHKRFLKTSNVSKPLISTV